MTRSATVFPAAPSMAVMLVLITPLLAPACVPQPDTPVLINEIQASNMTTVADEMGEFDDWIELYNPSGREIDLSGHYLSDDSLNPTRWIFPAASIIEAEGFLLVWCDGDTAQGPLHTSFRLSAGGEEIGLYGPADVYYGVVDRIEFDPTDADTSLARIPDGSSNLEQVDDPTPGESNGG